MNLAMIAGVAALLVLLLVMRRKAADGGGAPKRTASKTKTKTKAAKPAKAPKAAKPPKAGRGRGLSLSRRGGRSDDGEAPAKERRRRGAKAAVGGPRRRRGDAPAEAGDALTATPAALLAARAPEVAEQVTGEFSMPVEGEPDWDAMRAALNGLEPAEVGAEEAPVAALTAATVAPELSVWDDQDLITDPGWPVPGDMDAGWEEQGATTAQEPAPAAQAPVGDDDWLGAAGHPQYEEDTPAAGGEEWVDPPVAWTPGADAEQASPEAAADADTAEDVSQQLAPNWEDIPVTDAEATTAEPTSSDGISWGDDPVLADRGWDDAEPEMVPAGSAIMAVPELTADADVSVEVVAEPAWHPTIPAQADPVQAEPVAAFDATGWDTPRQAVTEPAADPQPVQPEPVAAFDATGWDTPRQAVTEPAADLQPEPVAAFDATGWDTPQQAVTEPAADPQPVQAPPVAAFDATGWDTPRQAVTEPTVDPQPVQPEPVAAFDATGWDTPRQAVSEPAEAASPAGGLAPWLSGAQDAQLEAAVTVDPAPALEEWTSTSDLSAAGVWEAPIQNPVDTFEEAATVDQDTVLGPDLVVPAGWESPLPQVLEDAPDLTVPVEWTTPEAAPPVPVAQTADPVPAVAPEPPSAWLDDDWQATPPAEQREAVPAEPAAAEVQPVDEGTAWWDDPVESEHDIILGEVPPWLRAPTDERLTGRWSLGGMAFQTGHTALTGVSFREPVADAPTRWSLPTRGRPAPGTIVLTVEALMNCEATNVEVVMADGFAPSVQGFTLTLAASAAGPFAASGSFRVIV